MISTTTKRALQYVLNTGGNCTISVFKQDHDPIGQSLLEELMPTYLIESCGKLRLTYAGLEFLRSK